MQYRKYGEGGPEVSILGFGVMRLPPRKKGVWGSVNFSKSVPMMRRAMELGVNFFDSHHNYHEGLSEVAIGKALKGWKGQRIYIQTKTPFYHRKSQDYFKKLLHEALEKMGVDCIDYLLFHAMNMEMFNKRGKSFFKFTDWAMKKGLIRHRGFSSHDAPENIRKFIDTGEFSCMLVSFNLLNTEQQDTIDYAHQSGMGVSVMNPVAGGGLAADSSRILSLVRGAKSCPEVALRHVLTTPGVDVAMSGMSTMEQVEENVEVVSRKSLLTTKQRASLVEKLDSIQDKKLNLCTHCGYCMPCPQGVDIPQNFLLLARAKLFGLMESSRQGYRNLQNHPEGNKSAEVCSRCGNCMPKCPNEIKITEQLKEVAQLLGD